MSWFRRTSTVAPDHPVFAPIPRGGVKRFSTEVGTARKKERARRNAEAVQRAYRALKAAHPDQYYVEYQCAVISINEERGPLPGDEA